MGLIKSRCVENEIHSVVFPLISAGIFGYPAREAWEVALKACREFLKENQDYNLEIIFAIPESQKIKIGEEILQKE